jgi:hypothetical protein
MPATFRALTAVSAFASNKVQFALDNTSGEPVWILAVVIKPHTTAVTGVAPSEWTLRRRNGRTTAPSGTGSVAIVSHDTNTPVPSGITAWNAPQTAPAGGTLDTLDVITPQADEAKLSTLDAPTMASLQDFGGVLLYEVPRDGEPITLRQNQTLELVQSATAGTGNCRVLVMFTTR